MSNLKKNLFGYVYLCVLILDVFVYTLSTVNIWNIFNLKS